MTRVAINTSILADAIDSAISSREEKVEINFYDLFKFDNLKYYDEEGEKQTRNDISQYNRNHVQVRANSVVGESKTTWFSGKRNLMNFLTHVVLDRKMTFALANFSALSPTQVRAHFNQPPAFPRSELSLPMTKTFYGTQSVVQLSIIPQVAYSDFTLSLEAYRNLDARWLAWRLATELAARIENLIFQQIQVIGTFYGVVPPFTPAGIPNSTDKDLVDAMYMFYSMFDHHADDEFIAVFRTINRYRRFYYSLKDTTNSYVLCNNCLLDEVIDFGNAKITYLPVFTTAGSAGLPANPALIYFWLRSLAYFIHDKNIYLTVRKEPNNTWIMLLETVVGAANSLIHIVNGTGGPGAASGISIVSAAGAST